MAKQQRPSKRAAKAITKKPPRRAAPATRQPSRTVTATAETRAARKPATDSKPAPRRKQRVAVSHYREEDFVGDGLRAYARYRDLGIAAATGGAAQAHVIRLIGPCDPAEVSRLHYHSAEFQLIYVLNGWVKVYLDGEGEVTMRPGSSWNQPPRVKHMIRDYSDNCELLEVILPAEFRTVEIKG